VFGVHVYCLSYAVGVGLEVIFMMIIIMARAIENNNHNGVEGWSHLTWLCLFDLVLA
jgi:hypothetical protein